MTNIDSSVNTPSSQTLTPPKSTSASSPGGCSWGIVTVTLPDSSSAHAADVGAHRRLGDGRAAFVDEALRSASPCGAACAARSGRRPATRGSSRDAHRAAAPPSRPACAAAAAPTCACRTVRRCTRWRCARPRIDAPPCLSLRYANSSTFDTPWSFAAGNSRSPERSHWIGRRWGHFTGPPGGASSGCHTQRRPPRRLPVRALFRAVRALPAGAASCRYEAGAHLPPRRADQGPPAPAPRRPRHRPQRLPGRAQPLHAARAGAAPAARGRTRVGAFAEQPLPWAKLRQGHKLLSATPPPASTGEVS